MREKREPGEINFTFEGMKSLSNISIVIIIFEKQSEQKTFENFNTHQRSSGIHTRIRIGMY